MKKTIEIIALILLTMTINTTMAATVGSGFSYQGELYDNGVPANDEYSFQIALVTAETGGTIITAVQFPNIQVVNGLFNIDDLDFGNTALDGTQYWLHVEVKKSSNPGSHTSLSPRQRLSAVPYAVQAEFLAANGATNGEILQFNGTYWVAQDSSAISAWDFDNNSVTTDKLVGIGTTNPNATIHISAAANDDPLRVQIGSATKFVVKNNGGMSIGVNGSPPTNGLYVQGDAKQLSSANGLLKYMVYAYCTDGLFDGNFTGPALINRSINNVNSSNINIANGADDGECVITFPSNISQRFWQTSVTGTDVNRGAHCTSNTSTSLRCYGVKLSNGSREVVNMMVLIY